MKVTRDLGARDDQRWLLYCKQLVISESWMDYWLHYFENSFQIDQRLKAFFSTFFWISRLDVSENELTDEAFGYLDCCRPASDPKVETILNNSNNFNIDISMTWSSLDVFVSQAGVRLIAGLESVSQSREGAQQTSADTVLSRKPWAAQDLFVCECWNCTRTRRWNILKLRICC